jgi:LAO/AO transport system kinase
VPRALTEDLFSRLEQGDRRAAARLITLVERSPEAAAQIVKQIHHRTGRAHVVGVTGSPGAGKSTLVDVMVDHLRAEGKTVGVVAVDPTSPFTGGALLGDRIRMQRRSTDPEVFIRSMGTRGHLGGVAAATSDAVKVLDAMGKDVIIIETVGVGQGEVEIMEMADTTVVVLVPGMGDDIQSIKAGLMEIADVFVVNKADRDGAERTIAEVEMNLMMGLGSKDPRRKQHSEAEEAHHTTKAKKHVDDFLAEDTVHEAEKKSRPKRVSVKKQPQDSAEKPSVRKEDAGFVAEEDQRRGFFEELLEAGLWYPPVLRTRADIGQGVEVLLEYLGRHHDWLESSGRRTKKLRSRAEREVISHVKERVLAVIEKESHVGDRFEALVQQVAERSQDPHTAAEEVLEKIRHALSKDE